MPDIDVKVTDNTKEIKEMAKNALQRALEAVGLQAEGYAKMNLYKGHGLDTGRLRNSVTHTTDGESVYIGTNVEYAPYVEFGTSKTKPKPFLKPAVEGHAEEYKRIYEYYLKNA